MKFEDDSPDSPPSPDESSGIGWGYALLIRLARRAGIDRAVAFAVMARLWQLFTGPITQLLIILRFTPSTQDYYYAFNNMLGMQVFVELGLHVVLINLASREWARLSLVDGKITGDSFSLNRLLTLGRMMVKWYLSVAVIFAIVLTVVGKLYFSNIDQRRLAEVASAETVRWMVPWLCLVLLNGLQLSLLPMTAILEGCHQLGPINRVRLWQGVLGTFVVWALVSSGLGLWALVGSAAVRVLGEMYLVFVRFHLFFSAFRGSRSSRAVLNWREEVLPLQWRMAAQGAVAWGANQMPVLVILHFHPSSGEAGRFGMTWTTLSAFQSACMALVETRRPLFGSLIARGEHAELDESFARFTKLAMLFMALTVTLFSGFIWLIGTRTEWLPVRISQHLLPVIPTALLSLAFIAYQFVMCIGIYVRAHRRDPFLVASVVSCLFLAAAEFWLGRNYGATGVSVAYVTGVTLVLTPFYSRIYVAFRRNREFPSGF